jgi:hypothetical protein
MAGVPCATGRKHPSHLLGGPRLRG